MKITRKKVVIIGDRSCGKTSLLAAFCTKTFPSAVPTLFENHVVETQVEESHVELALWDTADHDVYERLRHLCYSDTDVIIMCFSLENLKNLGQIRNKWEPEIKHFLPNVPYLLVGTKMDLMNHSVSHSDNYEENGIQFKSMEGKSTAAEIFAYAYVECSAKTMEGVRDVFEMTSRAAMLPRNRKGRKCVVL